MIKPVISQTELMETDAMTLTYGCVLVFEAIQWKR